MDCTQSARTQQALPQRRQPTTVDVTVIGAGPAGALLAYLLAVRGLPVVLVEKARLPHAAAATQSIVSVCVVDAINRGV